MSKTWDELSNDAFRLAENLYNDMIARGIEIDPKIKSKYDELSKLHQHTVISTVCDCRLLGHRRQYEFNLNECRLCGKQIKAN